MLRTKPTNVILTALAICIGLLPGIARAADDPATPYTGILIDVRHLPGIDRSPAPCIFGPQPESALLYPDRTHVPTPDEVQDESIVRYYTSEEDARKGFVGASPLILKAVEVVGPANDCIRLSAEDMARLREADRTVHFTQNWKVGFLIPGDIPHPGVAAPAVAAPTIAPALTDTTEYTGILIDVRHLPQIDRSPAPCIYGPEADNTLAYPDRSHVPTPDEVQEQSIVRYFHTEEEAHRGIIGAHPLVLKATVVIGPAHDCIRLSATDLQRLLAAEKTIHFTQTWKVGFLVPENR